MTTQSTSFDLQGLPAYYTDTEELLDLFKSMVIAPKLTKRILVIHGVGGVGKSSLLKMYRLLCKSAETPVALVSGDDAKSAVEILYDWARDLSDDEVKLPTFAKTYEKYRTIQAKVENKANKVASDLAKRAAKTITETALSTIPGVGPLLGKLGGISAEALVDWMQGQGFGKPEIELILDPTNKLTDDFLADINKVASTRRIVLMLDTFEQISALNNWVSIVAKNINTNVLIVIAGREMVNWDGYWNGWLSQVEAQALGPMTPEIMRTLVRRYYSTMIGGEPDSKQVESIITFAHGLPIVVTSAVRLWVKYGQDFDFDSMKAEVVGELINRLRQGVPAQMVPILEAAAIVRWFDKSILRAIIDTHDLNTYYEEFRRFPFVKSSKQGLRLHDIVREILNESLRIDDYDLHRTLHQRAAAYFEAQMKDHSSDKVELFTLERLYHLFEIDQEQGIILFQEISSKLEAYKAFSKLRGLLNDSKSYIHKNINGKNWWDYYIARLLYLENQVAEAEAIYRAVLDNSLAEPRLRGYVCCDLGEIWSDRDHVARKEDAEKTKLILENALTLIDKKDVKYSQALWTLGDLFRRIADLDNGIPYYTKAIELVEENQDQYEAVRLKQAMLVKVIWHCRFAAITKYKQILKDYSKVYETYPVLRQEFVEGVALPMLWMGRYSFVEGEQITLLHELESYNNIDDWFIERKLYVLRNLCYATGLEEKYTDSEKYYKRALELIEINKLPRAKYYQAIVMGLFGEILYKQGRIGEAEQTVTTSLTLKRSLKDVTGIPELLVILGKIAEHKYSNDSSINNIESAENFYNPSDTLAWDTRPYFKCSKYVGLVRVNFCKHDYLAGSSLMSEAFSLASTYEYNDCLSVLFLYKGYFALVDMKEDSNHIEEVYKNFREALIFALRFNRFLLDEILSGRPQGTPLHPIIPNLLKCGDKGRNMLVALRDWWLTGKNETGTPRPDTISLIPEGISLPEAERIAREREPGDGTPQRTVVEQINYVAG